ncbi:hypothetical protein [Agrobacterium vitis]|uniref:hypothetical protein n=1 Tax=Agrobacterium vitis TaxID=373 RepID=UPI003D265360
MNAPKRHRLNCALARPVTFARGDVFLNPMADFAWIFAVRRSRRQSAGPFAVGRRLPIELAISRLLCRDTRYIGPAS